MSTLVRHESPAGMKLLVNGVTLLGLLCAALSCFLLLQGEQFPAFALVLSAMVLDMLDGPIARKAGVSSKLGSTLDSCADVLIYLLFPAIYWAGNYGQPMWVLLIFVGAGIFRLVRFTLIGFGGEGGKLHYAGMPVFYSQLLLMLTLLLPVSVLLATALSLLLLIMSVLMVSTVPFAKIPVRLLAAVLVVYTVIVVLEASGVL